MSKDRLSSSWPHTAGLGSRVTGAPESWLARTPSTAGRPSSALPANSKSKTRKGVREGGPSAQLDLAIGSSDLDVNRLREQVRVSARNAPGVYIMRSPSGEVLYVGKSTRLRTRLLSYFRLPWPEHRHARMLRETGSLEWEPQPSEFASLLREVRLIRAHLPKYNVRSARPLDRWWVITVSDGPAPRLRIQRAGAAFKARATSRGAGTNNSTVIGPFSSRAPLKEALRVLNDALGLRDCSDRIPLVMRDAAELFDVALHPRLERTPGCHRFETRRCLGPCVAACSATEYRTQLTRARAVLEGRDATPQQSLVKEMTVASAALSYERAGWLRDRLAALQELEYQLLRVRESISRPSGVYTVAGHNGDDRIYQLQHGRVVQEACTTDLPLVAAIHEAAARRVPTPLGIAPHQLDEVLMVEQWFRTRPGEAGRFSIRHDYPSPM